jgi:hypothetical protein
VADDRRREQRARMHASICCCNRWAMFPPLSLKRGMQETCRRVRPWGRHSSNELSGEPGAVQTARRRAPGSRVLGGPAPPRAWSRAACCGGSADRQGRARGPSWRRTCPLNRLGFAGGSQSRENGAMAKEQKPKRYAPEVRERAVPSLRFLPRYAGAHLEPWRSAFMGACVPRML